MKVLSRCQVQADIKIENILDTRLADAYKNLKEVSRPEYFSAWDALEANANVYDNIKDVQKDFCDGANESIQLFKELKKLCDKCINNAEDYIDEVKHLTQQDLEEMKG